jgi:hypothetical protein
VIGEAGGRLSWLGAFLVASGASIDPLPTELEDLARRYCKAYPDAKA